MVPVWAQPAGLSVDDVIAWQRGQSMPLGGACKAASSLSRHQGWAEPAISCSETFSFLGAGWPESWSSTKATGGCSQSSPSLCAWVGNLMVLSGVNCFSVEGSSKRTQGATAAPGVLWLQMPFFDFLTFKTALALICRGGVWCHGFPFLLSTPSSLKKKEVSQFSCFLSFRISGPRSATDI